MTTRPTSEPAPTLEKQTRPPKLAVPWRPVVGASGAALSVAALVALWPRPSVAPRVEAVVVSAPVLETVMVPRDCRASPIVIERPAPPPEPAARFGPGSCPPMEPAVDPAVGAVWSEAFQVDTRMLDEAELEGVAVSPAAHGHLAVWTATSVFVSHDDGEQFSELAALPGELVAVAVDCRGAVLMLVRSAAVTRLGIHEDGETTWRRLPIAGRASVSGDDESEGEAVELVAGGGRIAVSASKQWLRGTDEWRRAILVTADGGRTWSEPVLDDEFGIVEGMRLGGIDARGVITVMGFEGDCMYDGTSIFRGKLVPGRKLAGQNISGQWQLHEAAARGRWAYAGRGCEGSALCALDLRGKVRSQEEWEAVAWSPVVGLPALGEDEEATAGVHLGRRSYVHAGRGLYRLRGARATRVAVLPPGVDLRAVDSSGRVVGFDGDGRLIRWSSGHGTRLLRGQVVAPVEAGR